MGARVSRRNLSNDFEAMYLRYNMAAKYMSEADKSILDDPQFKKVVSYMTNYYFNRYRDLMSSNGFEADDLRNVITVFGLTYWGHCKPEARDRKAFTLMMRYMSQKIRTMVRWISRKFGADEVVLVGFRTADSMQRAESMLVAQESESQEDEVQTFSDGDPYQEMLDAEQEEETRKTDKRTAADKRSSRMLVAAMRRKLEENVEEYSEQLCYYATSKHVAHDVRMRARKFCRQYGIDYAKWLKERADKLGTDMNQFTV